MTSFTDTTMLIGKQKFAHIAGWDIASSQLEAWAVLYTVFLGDDGAHPATYKFFLLMEETSGARPRLWAKAHHQSTFPASLIHLIQQEFNASFRQALDMRQMVRRPHFEIPRRALETGKFRPELVTLPGGLAPPERPLHPLSAKRRQSSTLQAAGNTPMPEAQGQWGNQVQEHNPHPDL